MPARILTRKDDGSTDLEALARTGWARPVGQAMLWHLYVGGFAVCAEHLSWPHAAEEAEDIPPTGACIKCLRTYRRATTHER